MLKNRIKELRKSQRLSVEQLAEMVGTSHAQITRLENGTRRLTVDWIDRIAKALKCSSLDLISNDSSPTKLNRELLQRVITGVEQFIKTEKLSFDPADKAKIISIIYDHVDSANEPIEDAGFQNQIKLVISALKND